MTKNFSATAGDHYTFQHKANFSKITHKNITKKMSGNFPTF